MAVSRYFNQTTRASEQNLLQDLWDEAIAIHGHDVYYIKRDDVNVDMLFGEAPAATFTHAYAIEMFVKSYSQFAGNGDFLSKFGLHIEDQCVFSCSVRRFAQVCGAVLTRPREGDYIYIQMTPDAPHANLTATQDKPHKLVFEIRKVDDKEDGLFQLGEHYTWQMTAEQVNYSHEKVQTNVPSVDAALQDYAYTINVAVGTGTGTYLTGETVYQGLTFPDATATGTVYAWDANTAVLSLQNITGSFGNTGNIVGVTSGASYAPPTDAPSTTPTVHDPIADNDTLTTAEEGVVIKRGGDNPRL